MAARACTISLLIKAFRAVPTAPPRFNTVPTPPASTSYDPPPIQGQDRGEAGAKYLMQRVLHFAKGAPAVYQVGGPAFLFMLVGAKRAPTNGTRVVSPRAAPRRCACGFAPTTRSESFAFLPRQGAPLNSRSVRSHTNGNNFQRRRVLRPRIPQHARPSYAGLYVFRGACIAAFNLRN